MEPDFPQGNSQAHLRVCHRALAKKKNAPVSMEAVALVPHAKQAGVCLVGTPL